MSISSLESSAAVLGDGLGSLADGVLGELTWKEESDGSLDLSAGEGVLSVVSHELGGLEGDLLEDILDEGVHDVHASLGNASLGVDLLEDSVDVHGEGLGSLSSSVGSTSLLAWSGSSLGNLGGWGSLGGSGGLLWGHFVVKFDFNFLTRGASF